MKWKSSLGGDKTSQSIRKRMFDIYLQKPSSKGFQYQKGNFDPFLKGHHKKITVVVMSVATGLSCGSGFRKSQLAKQVHLRQACINHFNQHLVCLP
ncbi:hypothetical protein HHK36_002004 [Tetracentron sinense]|uniref:Uncharacterized protein n=1 Tax=Tetracentron sinense TaxID=13715 RepID=A0A835A3R1_TETSI|nr:hypothetical protein HHK36_002004 [Tetracentron sinense]